MKTHLHILLTSCSSHVTTFYTEFYSETAFHFGFEKGEAREVALGGHKNKPKLKNANKVKTKIKK